MIDPTRFPVADLPSWLRPPPGSTFRQYVEWEEATYDDWCLFRWFRVGR